jgi:excisionase family DNA binding protein
MKPIGHTEQHTGDRLLKIGEVAQQLNVSRSTVYTLLGEKLRYAKVGRSTRIPQSAVRDFVERHTVGG